MLTAVLRAANVTELQVEPGEFFIFCAAQRFCFFAMEYLQTGALPRHLT